jgi:hypothetical protein
MGALTKKVTKMLYCFYDKVRKHTHTKKMKVKLICIVHIPIVLTIKTMLKSFCHFCDKAHILKGRILMLG